ncbi:hypothetical protein HOT31_gp110 [Microbacterium phage Hendrix]|uniref:Uncharacterized protein n=1 Tax=Microbacterium phage Hendrix TaxID=2182341 RepID=A0A2U8UUA9_9CAUD|nr:hypothetical protein HOT31_gp110 [Microbacterium phage Hendrix]AWN07781.1 hypothetical protein PBI_HENDRIX_110 [Microbacterium phage Hendrix]
MAELIDVVNRVQVRLKAAMPVWWKREGFAQRGNYSSTPQWHRLAKLEQGVNSEEHPAASRQWRWTALCGYAFIFDGLLGRRPDLKEDVKTKKLRCAKCEAKAAKIAAAGG